MQTHVCLTPEPMLCTALPSLQALFPTLDCPTWGWEVYFNILATGLVVSQGSTHTLTNTSAPACVFSIMSMFGFSITQPQSIPPHLPFRFALTQAQKQIHPQMWLGRSASLCCDGSLPSGALR